MYPKRIEAEDDSVERSREVLAVETTRSANESSRAAHPGEHKKDEEKVSVFWRVFGGTILSIVALVSITLYNNLTSSIADLRQEISREREVRASLAKKDEIDTRVKSLWDHVRTVEGYKAEIEAIRERTSANAAAVDGLKKEATTNFETLKRDAGSLDLLKERVVHVESLRKDVAALEAIKEKVTTAITDLKSHSDELRKLQQEVERNKVSDQERKTSRDSQMKNLEETLKELQKGLSDCREKIARLEGSQPPAPKDTKPTKQD